MEKANEQLLSTLLAHTGLEPKKGDLELFGPLIDTYMQSVTTLYSVDLGEEEIALAFHPE